MGRSLLMLILCLLMVIRTSSNKRVDAYVDGREISNVRDLSNALGWFGVNLFNLGFHQTQRNRIPKVVRIRARDINNSDHLENSAVGYLLQFGYIEMVTEKTETELTEGDYFIDHNDLSKALRELQKFHGLAVTGRPSVETQGHMMRARCGMKDVRYDSLNRAERSFILEKTLETKRVKNTLKYWFDPDKYTNDLDKDLVRSEVEEAFKLWSNTANISFLEVQINNEADIRISFEVGDHGDGIGGANSHVTPKGLLHFDDAEKFTVQTAYGTNLHYVATHQIGHLLGIPHFEADHRNNVMFPLYQRYKDNRELGRLDKAAGVAAVGAGEGSVQPLIEEIILPVEVVNQYVEPTAGIPDIPPGCIEKIDAVFHWAGNPEYLYLFAGSWYYRLVPRSSDSGDLLPVLDASVLPKRIGIDGLFGLPRNIDAAVESLDNSIQLYAFKGSKYYIYNMLSRKVIKEGSLSDLWPVDTPDKIDGALQIDPQTLGFLVEDKLYEYKSDTGEWRAGCDGSNYFRKFVGLDSLSVGFIRGWTWIFQGAWYSVARDRNGWESYTFMLRSIKADLGLPICAQQVGSLSTRTNRRCAKELRKMKLLAGRMEPSSACKDYIVDRYNVEVEFDMTDFN
ncbi:stromelysin-1-like [Bolinopsis microptera]|uniref:stromelysin-1-like n=1 Tax=Bolinopsis microptera TaxID=2820187 RepID=UPI003079633B